MNKIIDKLLPCQRRWVLKRCRLEMLVRRNHVDLSDPKYEELFLKYGTREILETIRRILRHR